MAHRTTWLRSDFSAACPPAGMPGQNVAADGVPGCPLLPAAAFGRCGSTLRVRHSARPLKPGCSKRPFARLERLSLSGPPLQGRSSWPASSLPPPGETRTRSAAPSPPLPSVSGAGEDQRKHPVARLHFLTVRPAGVPCSPSGVSSLRINARDVFPFGNLPPRNSPFRSLPDAV